MSAHPDISKRLTAAMREADRAFQAVGGSTRHYVNDCLLPALETARLSVVDALVPIHRESAERDVASLGKKLDTADRLNADLLAACEALLATAEFIFGPDIEKWPAQWREQLRAMRAAIAKARGA